MKAFTGLRVDVQKLATEADKVLGYPKPGVNVGGGVHAPAEATVTRRHAEPRVNRKTGEWTLPVDDDAATVCRGLSAAKVATVEEKELADPKDLWATAEGVK